MKRAITLRLCIVILLSMIVITFLSCYLQVKTAKDAMYQNSLIRIDQVSGIIRRNDTEMEQLKVSLKEDYLIRAKAAAYIVQNQPEVIGDLEALKKIAALLQVDELHLFDTEGTLYDGSEPKYYGYTFHSGEQMQFFLPMLDDYSLQLCQDVTPNTAESKLMQYLAVWREDHQGIVQIGMEPIRLLDAMKKNELSHIFTMITAEKGITIFAADPKTGDILGMTEEGLAGKNLEELGLDLEGIKQHEVGFTAKVSGQKNYYVMQQTGNVLVGVSSTYRNLYQSIPGNMALVIISLCILSAVIIFLILSMFDRFIIRGIYDIICGLKKIAAGDLDSHVEVTDTVEFVELSNNINSMVKSLLETTGKLSLVFQNVNIQIAVYEYNQDMRRVLATSKIGDILMLSDQELSGILSDRDMFYEKICQICSHPFEQEKDVYMLGGETTHYVKIKSYQEGRNTLGVIVDMTEEIREKQGIKLERDIDFLTGLLSRRAYLNEMDHLFAQPQMLGTVGILMTDLDNLKYVNDHWGHEYGDKLLTGAADLMKNCKAPHKLISRLSGDEFVLVIYGADSQEEIEGYLGELYARIMEAVLEVQGGDGVPIRISGGYIFYPEITVAHRELLRLADQTMYQVKRGTKGYFARYKAD